jgi:hypothetical protein
MKTDLRATIVPCLFAMAVAAGCATTKVATRQELVTGQLPRPTAQGLRKLGSGTVDSGGSKGPGAAVGVAGLVATGNPAGLIISTGMKVYGEESGSSKLEGRAKGTAKEIADVLKQRFEQQGWIQ